MKVLHASFQRFWAPGIAAQVEAEQTAAAELSIPWTSRLFTTCPDGQKRDVVVGPLRSLKEGANRSEYYRWLHTQLQDFDVLLLRHTPAAIDQAIFVNSIRIPFYLVHHTLEGPELAIERGLKATAKRFMEEISVRATLSQSAGIVAVTQEIADYERRRGLSPKAPAYVYPNGTIADDEQIQPDRRAGNVPVLLFVASHFAPWHGLDRILDAARNCDLPFVMHLVGRISPEDLREVEGDPRFVVHGVLGHDGILRLVQEAWIGLSSFALERKSLTMACTLKVREYLAAGLPVYAGHSDVFEDGFQFFKSGPCNIEIILKAARSARHWSRQDVAVGARRHIDKRHLLKSLYQAISG